VSEQGLAAPELVANFVDLPVKSTARVARVHLCCLWSHLNEPIKKISQLVDDVEGILRRAGLPAQAAGVYPGLAIERAGVESLGEILEQAIGVPIRRIGMQVFEKHPNRADHLRRPRQTAIVAAIEAIVEKGLQNPCRGQQHWQLGARTCGVGVDSGFDGHEHKDLKGQADATGQRRF